MSKGLEVDADTIEVDVVGWVLFIVLGRWQGSDLTKNMVCVVAGQTIAGLSFQHGVCDMSCCVNEG